MPILFATLATSRAMPAQILQKSSPLLLAKAYQTKSNLSKGNNLITKPKLPIRAPGLSKTLALYRMQQSNLNNLAPKNVLGDKLLKAIVAKRPETLEKLQTIAGMGQTRILKYGMDIIKIICTHKRNLKKAAKRKFLQRAQNASAIKTPRRPRPRPRPRPTQPRPYGPRCASSPETAQHTIVPADFNATKQENNQSVYILELEGGRVYVGVSRDVEKRVAQHLAGSGSAFTKAFRPTGNRLPRLGNVSGNGDATERDETLRYMHLRGKTFVRGWKYTQVELSEKDYSEAESNIRELFDLCRRCGNKGHFMSQCKCSRDRLGNLID